MTYRVIYMRRGGWVPDWRDFTTRSEAEMFAGTLDRLDYEDAEVMEVPA